MSKESLGTPGSSGSPLIFENGWCNWASHHPSPFYNDRPKGESGQVSLLVVHNISLPQGQFGTEFIDKLFLGHIKGDEHPDFESLVGLEVSSHFLIRRDGQLIQYVSCEDRAWHAGVSQWSGKENCNDFSIGVELEGSDDEAFEAVQYEVLSRLTSQLQAAYSITDIVGHSDIAPGRKTDPGECFDWAAYRQLLSKL